MTSENFKRAVSEASPTTTFWESKERNKYLQHILWFGYLWLFSMTNFTIKLERKIDYITISDWFETWSKCQTKRCCRQALWFKKIRALWGLEGVMKKVAVNYILKDRWVTDRTVEESLLETRKPWMKAWWERVSGQGRWIWSHREGPDGLGQAKVWTWEAETTGGKFLSKVRWCISSNEVFMEINTKREI